MNNATSNESSTTHLDSDDDSTKSTHEELRRHAFKYGTEGWCIFPLKVKSKEPLPMSHGFKDATTCMDTIERRWETKPHNIGLATGKVNGIVVVDVDNEALFLEFLEKQEQTFPDGLRVKTKKGFHAYFQYPKGHDIGSKTFPALGFDIRGNGGYVLAPPSNHPAGGVYHFIGTGSLSGLKDLVKPPKWLVDFLMNPKVLAKVKPANTALDHNALISGFNGTSSYGKTALEEECNALRGAAEGGRNAQLNESAFKIGRLVAGNEINENEAQTALEQAAISCGLGASEIRGTLASGFEAGRDKPRSALPNKSSQEQGLTTAPNARSLLPSRANKKPFKLTSIGELMKQPLPLRWLIKGYLPPEGLGFLIAAPATGKTFLAIDWFCHIACGLPWWGKRVKQGGVVVIAGEGHHGLRRRLKAWGINQGIVMDNKPIVVSDVAASLTDKASVEAVMDAIDLSLAQLESVDIIVIDTLHRNITGDENSSEDMAVYFNHLDGLRAKYECFILTVHHTGHGEQGRARGSSSIKAAIDVEYIISKSGDVAKVSCEKMKDGEKPKNFGFTLPEVTIPNWLDDDGNPETSVVVAVSEAEASSGKEKKLSDQIMIAFEALCILTVEAAKAEAESGEMKEKKENKIENTAWKYQAFIKLTHDNEDSKQKAFNRGKNALIKAGYVDVESNHYWIEDLKLSHQTSTILNRVSAELSLNPIMG